MKRELVTSYTDSLNLSYISDFTLKVIPSLLKENSRFETYRTKGLQVTGFNLHVLRWESSWLGIWIWFWRLCVCADTFGSVPHGCSYRVFNLTYSIASPLEMQSLDSQFVLKRILVSKNTDVVFTSLKWPFLELTWQTYTGE